MKITGFSWKRLWPVLLAAVMFAARDGGWRVDRGGLPHKELAGLEKNRF